MNVNEFSTITVDLICNSLRLLPVKSQYIGVILNVFHCCIIILNIVLLIVLKSRENLHYLLLFNLAILLSHILFKKCLLIKVEQCFTKNIVIDKVFFSIIEYFNLPDNKCSSYNSILVIIHAMLVLIKYVYTAATF